MYGEEAAWGAPPIGCDEGVGAGAPAEKVGRAEVADSEERAEEALAAEPVRAS